MKTFAQYARAFLPATLLFLFAACDNPYKDLPDGTAFDLVSEQPYAAVFNVQMPKGSLGRIIRRADLKGQLPDTLMAPYGGQVAVGLYAPRSNWDITLQLSNPQGEWVQGKTIRLNHAQMYRWKDYMLNPRITTDTVGIGTLDILPYSLISNRALSCGVFAPGWDAVEVVQGSTTSWHVRLPVTSNRQYAHVIVTPATGEPLNVLFKNDAGGLSVANGGYSICNLLLTRLNELNYQNWHSGGVAFSALTTVSDYQLTITAPVGAQVSASTCPDCMD